jgi:hypothetical protein
MKFEYKSILLNAAFVVGVQLFVLEMLIKMSWRKYGYKLPPLKSSQLSAEHTDLQ